MGDTTNEAYRRKMQKRSADASAIKITTQTGGWEWLI